MTAPQKLGPYAAGETVEFEISTAHEDGSVADLTGVVPHVYVARADDLTAIACSTGEQQLVARGYIDFAQRAG